MLFSLFKSQEPIPQTQAHSPHTLYGQEMDPRLETLFRLMKDPNQSVRHTQQKINEAILENVDVCRADSNHETLATLAAQSPKFGALLDSMIATWGRKNRKQLGLIELICKFQNEALKTQLKQQALNQINALGQPLTQAQDLLGFSLLGRAIREGNFEAAAILMRYGSSLTACHMEFGIEILLSFAETQTQISGLFSDEQKQQRLKAIRSLRKKLPLSS